MENAKLMEQAVQFTFSGENYKKGELNKTYKNVALDATSTGLLKFGKAISRLQKDDGVTGAILIQKSDLMNQVQE